MFSAGYLQTRPSENCLARLALLNGPPASTAAS